MDEKTYIAKRKIEAFFNGLCHQLCGIFPLKKDRITVCTFEGKGGFGCNPRYIVEELHKRNAGYEIIWLMNDINREFPDYIRKVKNTQWNRAYWLATSKIWIDNYRKPYGTKKRNRQYYINTWHGTLCIKPIGKYRGKQLPKIACLVSEDDSKNIDYVLSGSRWCDEHYPKGLLYSGRIVRTGSPRCDILINRNDEVRKKIRDACHIPEKANILMYAPTFRGGSQNTDRKANINEMQIEFEPLIEKLEKRFGGIWYVFFRLHPQLAVKSQYCRTKKGEDRFIDVTQYPDMNSLMAGIDAFITDYSSAVFEACLMKIPCFIYADDIAEYINDRGNLFFNLRELPFPIAVNNHELQQNVEKFNDRQYRTKLQKFITEQDITEDGHASERAADLIEQCIRDIII